MILHCRHVSFLLTTLLSSSSIVLLSLSSSSSSSFASAFAPRTTILRQARSFSNLYGSSASIDEVSSMRAGEIKKELESYGISTKSFLEKTELVDALVKAREDGLQPKASSPSSSSSSSSTTSQSSTSSSTSSSSSSSSTTTTTRPREERLQEEIANCEKLKATELKQELQARGISTKSFFEKSEFVKAVAEARVDGINNKKNEQDEEVVVEYPEVEVLTDDSSGPRTKQSQQQQQQQQQSPFGGSPFGGAGVNPFGGGGGGAGVNPFGSGMGGMGGMGGIADMLKNMGMGGGGAAGGGAANPFGGMGGMGGMGDAMGKAQELMKNPKVMELMAKAQKNPKIMKAMTECMSNPAAFAKYQNDPEVAELVNELQKYM